MTVPEFVTDPGPPALGDRVANPLFLSPPFPLHSVIMSLFHASQQLQSLLLALLWDGGHDTGKASSPQKKLPHSPLMLEEALLVARGIELSSP